MSIERGGLFDSDFVNSFVFGSVYIEELVLHFKK